MKCKTAHCRNEGKPNICNKCRDRKFKEAHPIEYAYNKLKHNSKRRGKEFDLSIDEFRQFCIETQYLRGVGKTSKSFSIDRKDNNKGYTKDNIQVLTLGDNTRKLNKKMLMYDYQFPELATTVTLQPTYARGGYKKKD